MSKSDGFTLIELLVSLALSILLAFIAFELSSRFVGHFRSLPHNANSYCLLYTALQMMRDDLEKAPAELSLYVQISDKIVHFYLPDKSQLKWDFDKQNSRLRRTHYYVDKGKLTADTSIILEQVSALEFKIYKIENNLKKVDVEVTHNGKFLKTVIKLRNRIL